MDFVENCGRDAADDIVLVICPINVLVIYTQARTFAAGIFMFKRFNGLKRLKVNSMG